MNRSRTDFLCPKSSILTGLGSIFDLRGSHFQYNYSEDPDGVAIAEDWKVVGDQLRDAIDRATTVASPMQPFQVLDE